MRAIQVSTDGEFQVADVSPGSPGPNEVRIEVAACGVCGGDAAVTEGRPVIEYPRTPGHEVAGRVTATGDGVEEWTVDDRVAVGWHGAHCFSCRQCRRGDFVNCERERITGIHHDGGYAESMTAPVEALIPVPDEMSLVEAGPLACAGLTAYSALSSSGVGPGDRVAVQGIGGVGHLGVQFADAFGAETVAVSRGTAKREAALELGADRYVDAEATDPAEALADLGGADTVLSTAPSGRAIASVVDGLRPNGEVVVVGAPDDPVEVAVPPMLGNRWSVRGWSAGHPGDAVDAFAAALRNDVEPWLERYPLADAESAFRRMQSGEARFRTVLEP